MAATASVTSKHSSRRVSTRNSSRRAAVSSAGAGAAKAVPARRRRVGIRQDDSTDVTVEDDYQQELTISWKRDASSLTRYKVILTIEEVDEDESEDEDEADDSTTTTYLGISKTKFRGTSCKPDVEAEFYTLEDYTETAYISVTVTQKVPYLVQDNFLVLLTPSATSNNYFEYVVDSINHDQWSYPAVGVNSVEAEITTESTDDDDDE